MAPEARTTTRLGTSLLESLALALAALTALAALARYEAAAPACSVPPPAQSGRTEVLSSAAPERADHGAILRDMLLHD